MYYTESLLFYFCLAYEWEFILPQVNSKQTLYGALSIDHVLIFFFSLLKSSPSQKGRIPWPMGVASEDRYRFLYVD